MESTPTSRRVSAPVVITVILLVAAAIAFFVALVTFSPSRVNEATPEQVDEVSLAQTVDRLLAIGDASRAEPLIQTYTCFACHRMGNELVAPQWSQLSSVAGTRRPPLSAAEYIYELIINPTAFVVEGYAPTMPLDFAARMSEQEIADVLVYLVNGGT